MPTDPIDDYLARVAELAGAPDPEEAGVRLGRLARLIHGWNLATNLTGHRTLESIARDLVGPAAGLASVLPDSPTRSVDLGSGAGIPGFPLVLVRPGQRVLLVEARERRHYFQREAIRVLGLEDRVEALRARAEHPPGERFGLVLAQAMAPPERALGWMLGWVEPGGWLVLPLGRPEHQPRMRSGVEHAELRRYRLPDESAERWVWVGRAAA